MSGRLVLATLVLIAATGRAHGGPGRALQVTYVAPAGCPDEISLRAGVIARLGYDPFRADAPLRADVRLVRFEGGFVATIDLADAGGPAGRRELAPAVRCEDAVAALELALAVIVDPTGGAPPPVARDAPPPPVARDAPPPPVAHGLPDWRPQPPAPPRVPTSELALAVGALTGSLPETGGSFAVAFGYLRPGWRVGVRGRIASSNGDLDPAGERSHDTRVSEVLIEGCLRRSLLLACGVGGFGSKSVTVDRYTYETGYMVVADYDDAYVVLGAAAALQVPLGVRWFVRATVDVTVPLPAVPVRSEGVVRVEPSIAQLGFDLGLGFAW